MRRENRDVSYVRSVCRVLCIANLPEAADPGKDVSVEHIQEELRLAAPDRAVVLVHPEVTLVGSLRRHSAENVGSTAMNGGALPVRHGLGHVEAADLWQVLQCIPEQGGRRQRPLPVFVDIHDT